LDKLSRMKRKCKEIEKGKRRCGEGFFKKKKRKKKEKN